MKTKNVASLKPTFVAKIPNGMVVNVFAKKHIT